MVIALIAAVILFVLPLIIHLFRDNGTVARGADAFVLTAVLGITFIAMLPELLAHEHLMGIGAFATGVLTPLIFERLLVKASMTAVFVVIPVFILHCALDGAALVAVDNESLTMAILLHRLPVGLLIYLVASQRWTPRFGFGLLFVFGLATLAGGYFGDGIIKGILGDSCPFLVEAFLGGALLHVVFHVSPYGMIPNKTVSSCHTTEHETCDHKGGEVLTCHGGNDTGKSHCGSKVKAPQFPKMESWKGRAEFVGVMLAIVVIGVMGHIGGHGGPDAQAVESAHHDHSSFPVVESFVELALDSSVALLVAYVLGGLLHAFFPMGALRWLRRGRALMQSLKGVAFGLPLPICSCGVLPLYETLTRKGVPTAAGMAFLVATPELGLDAVLLSLPLLGEEFTVVRIVAAFILALSAGVLLSMVMKKHEPGCSMAQDDESDGESKEPLGIRLKRALLYGSLDLVDNTMPWVLVGLGIAAICVPALSPEVFGGVDPMVQVPLFALIGIPVYVCASGATPIAAVALLKGVSPGAALAFLLTGPATNATTFGVLRNLHGAKSALAFAVVVGVFSIGLGLGVNVMLGSGDAVAPTSLHGHGMLQWGCLAILLGLTTYGILRKGTRGFFRKITRPH